VCIQCIKKPSISMYMFKSQLRGEKKDHTASIFVQSSRSTCKFFGVTIELQLALSRNTEPSSV